MDIGLQVVVLGLGIVFSVLFLLIGIISLISRVEKKVDAFVESDQQIEQIYHGEDNNSSLLPAVIAAAVYQFMYTEGTANNVSFRVRSIRRI